MNLDGKQGGGGGKVSLFWSILHSYFCIVYFNIKQSFRDSWTWHELYVRYTRKMSTLALASMHVCVSIYKLFLPILIEIVIISYFKKLLCSPSSAIDLPVAPHTAVFCQFAQLGVWPDSVQEHCRHWSSGECMVSSHGKYLGNFSAMHDDHA